MNKWNKIPFTESIVKNKTAVSSVNASDYLETGAIPVIDQSVDFIAGYTNKAERIVSKELLPVIVFGDHTRVLKYIDFPFVTGADGTKLLFPNKSLFNSKFFYYNLLSKPLPNRGYNRHFKLLQELTIDLPTQTQQHVIVHILDTLDKKINLIKNELTKYKQLKQALMEKLFYSTADLPNGWEIKRVGEVVGIVKKNKVNIGDNPIPFIPMSLIADDRLYCQNFEMRSKNNIASGTYFENKALLVSKITPCFENGKQGIADIPNEYGITSTEIIPLKSKTDTFNIKYLHYLLIEKNRRTYLASTMEGTTGRQRLKTSVLLDLSIPVAPIEEQNRIIYLLEGVDQKVDVIKGKLTIYNNLFNSLLHKLMNQEIDISNLEFKNA